MLIIIILPLLVDAEWVEISQNVYKKVPSLTSTHLIEETTSRNILYNNDTIVDRQWSRGYVHRINSGSIKRVKDNERMPAVRIERIPFQHGDMIVTVKPDRRSDITEIKPGNRVIAVNNYEDIDYGHGHSTPSSKISNQLHNDYTTRNNLDFIRDRTKQDGVPKLTEREGISSKIVSVMTRPDNAGTVSHNVNKSNVKTILNEDQTTPHTVDYIKHLKSEYVKNTGNKQEYTPTHDDKDKNNSKKDALAILIKFLKMVSQAINQGTRRSFKSKVRYLEDLSEDLMASIESRIDSAFPDDNTDQKRRRRASGAESRGHVEFPSSESALMTISFLTFAVFLIKLVLQVIHTYKAKTMMVTPAVVATVGRAAKAFKKSTHN